ncbi:MAG: DUF1311 domain-containing protein [Clostridia bacterium]|nr:DUF1311 domain-containing protein [Clostridia bacterium]
MKRTLIALMTLLALAVCLTGCRQEPVSDAGNAAPSADPLISVRERASALRHSLEQEAQTQTEMNQISEDLRTLWDDAMNQLLEDAERTLPRDELERLTAEQRAWEAGKLAAVVAAGEPYEGGSLYPLIVNSEAARLTEERVLQLYELLK